jgi:hypothetical protein
MEAPPGGETIVNDDHGDDEEEEAEEEEGEEEEEESDGASMDEDEEEAPPHGTRSPPRGPLEPAGKKPRTLHSFFTPAAVPTAQAPPPPSLEQLRVLLPLGTTLCEGQSISRNAPRASRFIEDLGMTGEFAEFHRHRIDWEQAWRSFAIKKHRRPGDMAPVGPRDVGRLSKMERRRNRPRKPKKLSASDAAETKEASGNSETRDTEEQASEKRDAEDDEEPTMTEVVDWGPDSATVYFIHE